MANTDKDTPYRLRRDRGEVGRGNPGSCDSGFRHGRHAEKRRGNKAARRGETKPTDSTASVRAAMYYH